MRCRTTAKLLSWPACASQNSVCIPTHGTFARNKPGLVHTNTGTLQNRSALPKMAFSTIFNYSTAIGISPAWMRENEALPKHWCIIVMWFLLRRWNLLWCYIYMEGKLSGHQGVHLQTYLTYEVCAMGKIIKPIFKNSPCLSWQAKPLWPCCHGKLVSIVATFEAIQRSQIVRKMKPRALCLWSLDCTHTKQLVPHFSRMSILGAILPVAFLSLIG